MKTHLKNHKGFTIIELLVVVAIISVLTGIVLANVTSYIKKGKDAAVKANMDQMAKLMTINYEEYGSYCQLQYGWFTASGPTCDSVPFTGIYADKARNICNAAFSSAGENNWGSPGQYKIYANTSVGCGTAYSFMTFLNDGYWYCIGSSGAKGEYASYDGNPGCYNNP